MNKHNNMNLCLGYSALTNWESLMIREGIIDRYDSAFSDTTIPESAKHMRIYNKSFLLFSIVLFDKIDSSSLSMYNMDRLVDLGLVNEHATMIEDHSQKINETAKIFHGIDQHFYDIYPSFVPIKETAEIILRENKEKVINALKKSTQQHETSVFYHWHDLSRYYEQWISDCDYWACTTGMDSAKELLGVLKHSLMYGLYDSHQNGSVYYDGSIFSKKAPSIHNTSFGDKEICRIMNIDLSPELYHFPIPSSFEEALVLRNRPEIESFRKVFFEWCSLLKNGDLELATKIKSDIQLAQKGLEKYYKWEDSKIKHFNCLIDVIIGQIPYLCTLVGLISPFQTRSILSRKKENSWILLLR